MHGIAALRRTIAARLHARPDTHVRPPDIPARPNATQRDDRAMPAWLLRAYLLAVAVAFGAILTWWLLGRLRDLLVLLLLAQFLAFAIEPAVNWLATRGWRRGAATGVVMLVVALSLVGLTVAVGSLVLSEVSTLVEKTPSYIDGLVAWSNDAFNAGLSSEEVRDRLTGPDGPLSRFTTSLARDALDVGTGALAVVFQALTVALFAFYLCADGPRVRHTVCSVLPPARQREVLRAWEIAVDKTGGYLYSRLLLALVSGFAHYVALRVIGVPYALALALWIGLISQLVPTVGTYLAAALPLVVALVTDPRDALVLLVFIVLYQQIENYLLQPKITAHTLDMHPAIAFGAVIAGAAVLGGIGALLAIPFAAIVQSFVGTYIRRYDVEEHPLTELREAETDGELGTTAQADADAGVRSAIDSSRG